MASHEPVKQFHLPTTSFSQIVHINIQNDSSNLFNFVDAATIPLVVIAILDKDAITFNRSLIPLSVRLPLRVTNQLQSMHQRQTAQYLTCELKTAGIKRSNNYTSKLQIKLNLVLL